MQHLGGQRPPKDILHSQRLAHVPWSGLWPPKSLIFLTENVSDKSGKNYCATPEDGSVWCFLTLFPDEAAQRKFHDIKNLCTGRYLSSGFRLE